MSTSRLMICNIIGILLILKLSSIEGQTFNLSGSASYGIRGEDYRFTCLISGGNMPAAVQFNRGSSTVCSVLSFSCQSSPPDTRYTCGCINGNNRLLYLNITNVQSTDAGIWSCRDFDVIGGSSQPVNLLVYYPPSITSLTSDASNNMVDKDSIVTLACSVDSLPSSVISWSRSQQGEQLYSGSPYTIPKASYQHTDNYTCTANNYIGQPVSKTIPLYVRCIPVLDTNQETKTSIFVPHGETGVLTIHVLAYPLPVYSWYYQLQDGSKQLITDFRTTQTDAGLSSTLTIQDVTEDDSGKYIVYVNNSLGTRSTVFNLVVSSQDTDVNGCNNMIGVGIAIGMGISVVVVGVVTALAWVILKGSGRRFCAKENDQRVVKDTVSHDTGLGNIILSDTPHVYDQVNTGVTHTRDTVNTGVTNTRDTVNTGVIETNTTESTNTCTDYINTSTTSPYEELDKQTIDQQPNTYQQLSPYQNLTGNSN